jgi:Protein of unknown function (DUF2946)
MLAIMTTRSRKPMTAWLGLVAMWLIVFAPVVSQSLASHSACAHEVTIDAAGEEHHAGHHHHAPADHLCACGYCGLLAHHALAPPTASPQLLPAARYGIAEAFPPSHFVSSLAYPTARPRDSPSLV